MSGTRPVGRTCYDCESPKARKFNLEKLEDTKYELLFCRKGSNDNGKCAGQTVRQDKGNSKVIFTRFYDTLVDIVQRLKNADPRILAGTYSGKECRFVEVGTWKLKSTDREDVKHRFLKGEIDVLVCTDAAAEGLNLQTADMIVNFDLGWNPMKIEQRIGRIDRIGQRHDRIFVLNLCYFGSAEEIVYGRLLHRLAEADSVVGEQQFSMAPVYKKEFLELAEGRLTEEALEEKIRERYAAAGDRTRSREISPRELYEIYKKLSEDANRKVPPVTLDAIRSVLFESEYLKSKGCLVLPDESMETMVVNNIPGIPDKTPLTASRETFERGLPNDDSRPRFASCGDPAFDALLKHMAGFPLPESVARIELPSDKRSGPLAGYAVSVVDDGGNSECVLVAGLNGLDGLSIDEKGKIDESDLERIEARLKDIANGEFGDFHVASRMRSKNGETALPHLALNCMAVASDMKSSQKPNFALPNFRDEVRRMEETCRDKKWREISSLPADLAKRLAHPLWKIEVPNFGSLASVKVPVRAFLCALDSVCRLANAMHAKKAELATEVVLNRLERELKRDFRGFDA